MKHEGRARGSGRWRSGAENGAGPGELWRKAAGRVVQDGWGKRVVCFIHTDLADEFASIGEQDSGDDVLGKGVVARGGNGSWS